MNDNLKKLLELASSDQELAQKLENADKEAMLQIAKEQGIALTEEDFNQSDTMISDEELDAVAGGKKCGCAVTGMGLCDEKADGCVCACGGAGKFYDKSVRCVCVMGGYGKD